MSNIKRLRGPIAEKWLVLIAVTHGMFLSLVDATIVNVAIPQLQLIFGADVSSIQWTGIGLREQIPVTTMSQIETNEHKEIANASTLLIVLHSTATPMGVAALSVIVQLRSQYFSAALTAQGMKGELLNRQSSISAMHEGFLVDLIVALSAFGAMCLVPKDDRRTKANPARFAAIFKQ
jgi:hypothetical protein